MDLVVLEYDQNYVLECFRRREFDFVDGVSEVAETEFFRYIGAKKILGKLPRPILRLARATTSSAPAYRWLPATNTKDRFCGDYWMDSSKRPAVG